MRKTLKFLALIFCVVIFLFTTNVSTYAAIVEKSNKSTNNETQNIVNNTNVIENKNNVTNKVIDNTTNDTNSSNDNETANKENNVVEDTSNDNKKEETNENEEEINEENIINKNEVLDKNNLNNEVITNNTEEYQVPEKKNVEKKNNKTKDNGIYKMAVGKDSSKTIEIKGSSVSNNAEVDIWNYGNVPAQKFYFEYDEEGFYKITAMHTRKSLTAKGNKVAEGVDIVQYDYQGLDSQKWVLRDSGKNGWVISSFINPELSISIEGNIKNGSKMVLKKTQDNDNQMFYLFNITAGEQHKENGIYKMLVGKDSSKSIEIEKDLVHIWKYGNKLSQKLKLEYMNGFYKITSANTGKSLTAKDNKMAEGTEIIQSEYQGLDSQKWIIRDSGKNGWVISLFSNPQLSITIKGKIDNGSSLILSKTQDNNNQMLYMYIVNTDQPKKENGIYKISVAVNTSKTIEVAGSNIDNNAKVDIWNYGNVPAQKFYISYDQKGFYKITAMHTGKSLTVKDNKIAEGTEIVQSEYQGLDSQKWILRDTTVDGWAISPQSNPELSLSVQGNIKNGSKIILADSKDTNNQIFYLYNITSSEQLKPNDEYKILVGADSSKGVEVAGSDTANNAKVGIWNYGNADAQKFNFEYKEGFYKITAKHTGKSLTVKGNNLKEGAEIVQYDYQGLDSQKWIIRDSGKNGWVISLFSNPQLSITVEGNIKNGSKMILSKTQDNNNQMFYLYKTRITIVINPGHGGSEIGCANGSLAEKNVTLNIAKKLQANLSKYKDVKVILTRTGDYYMDLPSRAMIARNNNADLYISLHINDEESHRATGSQMYVPFYEGTRHYNSNMTKLANLIQDKLGAIGIRENLSGGITRRNIDKLPKYQYLMNGQVVQADYYADIRHAMKGDTMDYGPDLNTNTGIPTILVEHCFMNSSDSRFLDSGYDLQRIADADSAAIVEYFNL